MLLSDFTVVHNSREIEIGIAYEIYLLSCMIDPAAVYGLIHGSTMVFLNVSVDVRLALAGLRLAALLMKSSGACRRRNSGTDPCRSLASG